MIPILYDKNEYDFEHNGIGILLESNKAIVSEERNGLYELSMQYPITGKLFKRLEQGCIIKAKPNDTSGNQLFRVYNISKPLNGIANISAEHISYDLSGLPVTSLSVSNGTAQTAITQALQNTPLPHDFTAISDITTLNSTNITAPCSIRSVLGGQSGSVLDIWGGEYEFDNYIIKLHAHRGADNGVTVEYGKNLKDIKQECNIAECYTHLMPYAVYNTGDGEGATEEVYVYLTEKVIPLVSAVDNGHAKAFIMDFTDKFGENEEITETKLRQKATAYAQTADLGVPRVNITVSFVQLWQTEEYKNIAPLEKVSLCDTVRVRYAELGITATAKVIKTIYNCLTEKYESVTIGDAKSTLVDTVYKNSANLSQLTTDVQKNKKQASLELLQGIARATSLITGHSGGYIVLNPSEHPEEILILDTPNIETAVNVWRWNSGGLGFSSTGYNGNYETAITMDGAINANFITVGTISASAISTDIATVYKELLVGVNENESKKIKFSGGANIHTASDGIGYNVIETSSSGINFNDLLEVNGDSNTPKIQANNKILATQDWVMSVINR